MDNVAADQTVYAMYIKQKKVCPTYRSQYYCKEYNNPIFSQWIQLQQKLLSSIHRFKKNCIQKKTNKKENKIPPL